MFLLLSHLSSPFLLNIVGQLFIESVTVALSGIQIQLDDLCTPHVLARGQKNEESEALILS